MKGNPMKLGSIASKSTMKLKDKVMKMKKEAAMKMKKESMAKMKEAMAKMKKDPMMMKKGSPMEMKKGDEAMKMKKAAPTKILGKVVKAAKKAHKGLVKGGANVVKKAAGALSMKKGAPMKQKMNMVKGPDGKMVPDFAVDGKGANDMKKSPAKIAKPKTKNKTGRLKPVPSKKTGRLGDMTKMSAADRKKLVENMKKKSPNKRVTKSFSEKADAKTAKLLKKEQDRSKPGGKGLATKEEQKALKKGLISESIKGTNVAKRKDLKKDIKALDMPKYRGVKGKVKKFFTPTSKLRSEVSSKRIRDVKRDYKGQVASRKEAEAYHKSLEKKNKKKA